ncbi:MAG TPA: Calx-beta domain-containing protein [Pyrinomonadaceae bacterium]|nr:Calx-beta domain-containing protein [Pyrinomonadaceae bacterium]
MTAPVTQLVIDPAQPLRLYAGTGNGVFRSTDAGKTWSAINNGLTARFVTALVIDPLTPTTLYVASLDSFGNASGIYKSIDGGNSWNLRNNGITNTSLRSMAIDPVTPTTLYAGAFNGPIYKTTDGADNWTPSANTPPPFFPNSLAVDPHTPTRIFASESIVVGNVFRSIDSGATWQSVLSQIGAHAASVSVSPLTPGLVYATLNDVGIFKSVDGGDTWTLTRPGNGKIVFDPVNASTLYFLSTTEGLLKSTDNGATWIPRNNGLPVKNTVDLVINPLRPSTLHLATALTQDEDAFVTKINPAGSALIYSTLVGGTQAANDSLNINDEAFAIAIDLAGNAYITGFARSPDFPTSTNAYQNVNLGFADTFITKLTASYIIRGHVLDTGNAPVNGAEVALSDGASVTAVVTEADGAYEFSHLREGGSFTVSASKAHFTMAPPSQSFSNLNSNQTLDFTATATNAPFVTISGQVTNNTVGLPGVMITLGGSQLGTRITDSNGFYSFEVPSGGNYTLTISAVGFAFDPPGYTFNNLTTSRVGNFAANRQNFVVTNANDHGSGSLREAIATANAIPGSDTIIFNIPGAGVKVINLLTPLPEITDPIVIDASTQPGYAHVPLIQLNGANAGFTSGLVITAGGSIVRGLAIGSFDSAGIVLRSCNSNVIEGNYIGVDAAGTVAQPNDTGILMIDSSNNVIGGTNVAARNVISGNVTGIKIGGANNIVSGNFIGTNAGGTAAIGNRDRGIEISTPTFTHNVIGGNSAGAGNLISGNGSGIFIFAALNTIQGNLIGTDISGTHKIGNGIGIQAQFTGTVIGGLTSGARNVISGNGTGVVFGEPDSSLQGNFIGTDITGTAALGNTFDGVIVTTGARVGGSVPEARNVISGNGASNVSIGSLFFDGIFPHPISVEGNYIGTDVTGNRALTDPALGTTSSGIFIFGSRSIVGGVEGRGNVISGNAVGVRLKRTNLGPPAGNIIQGNLIGLNAAGTEPVPNTQGGIELSETNGIGGANTIAANKIAFNGGPGVIVFSNSSGTSIVTNSIFSNDGLGIDLGPTGVTPNDPADSDAGANNLQNFPVLTSVVSVGNSTTIHGSLNSTPNTTFRIDFYSNAALDPSGNGEGALFFNTTSVTTDSNGDATIDVVFPVPLAAGRVVTSTATDPNGNTSEFSAGDVASASGNAQFSVSSMRIIEDLGLATITVLRKGGSSGNLTVDYATLDGTATAGQDYTATSGTLTFSNGETTKSFQIPILDDAVTEPDETFSVVLRNAANPEALGAPNKLVITVQDHSTVPIISHTNASVVEGDAGTTTDALFTFTLSAATGRLVSVNYATENISAKGGNSCDNHGTDYETVSGTISFQSGNTSVTIPVKICGDASAEPTETFRINLSSPSNAAVGFPQPVGTIIDDDVLELLLDESGPAVNQAAALDAFLMLRDPFHVLLPDWITLEPDRNTRVMFFVRGLQLDPDESSSDVTVQLIDSNNHFFSVAAEDVRAVPDFDFTQVVIRLPDDLAEGTQTVTVFAHTRVSNSGTIRIAP